MEVVTLSLERYNQLFSSSIAGEQLVKDLHNQLEEAKALIKTLQDEVMKENLYDFMFDEDSCDIDVISDYDGYNFALRKKEKMLNLGISKERMAEFIKAKYKEKKGDIE